MIGAGLFIVTILSNCVLALPVTSSHLENEDVKVMKCIVEALADVLSRPRPLPISEECLVILKTDDRLVTILRRHSFLKELQDIAIQGGQERAQLDHVTRVPQTTDDVADQSMLEALGGPGERSILTQKKRSGDGDGEKKLDESLRDNDSQEGNEIGGKEQDESEKDESHVNEWSVGKAEKREDEREEEEDEEDEGKRANSEENSEEENMTRDMKGDESDEKRDTSEKKSEKKKFAEEENEKEVEKKKSALFSHDPQMEREEEAEEEDGGEMKKGSTDGLKRWTKRAKSSQTKRKAGEEEGRQEGPHHSKEVTGEDEDNNKGDAKRSPEEKELQMIARREPGDRRVSEEEGSASRRSEDPEIESLAGIESELESVAQKLHELSRG
ncbi:chromogranin-A [Diretmus argenteus]